MEEKICYYCGTKYSAEEERCPLCGQTETVSDEIDEIPVEPETPSRERGRGAREAVPSGGKRRNKSNLFATLLCIFLAVAVVGCSIWILNSIGILSFEPAPADESALDLPVEDETEETVTDILIEPSQMSFSAAGQKSTLLITFQSDDMVGVDADPDVPVLFESADPDIAEVSADGEVTAVGDGVTIVTATYGDLSASCRVSCDFAELPGDPLDEDPENTHPDEQTPDEEPEAEFSLNKDDFTLFSAGEKASVKALNVPDGAAISWTSKNQSVATVSDGVVTAVGPGVTTINASYNGKTVSCIVRCRFEAGSEPAATTTDDGVSLSTEDVTLTEQGESFTLRLLSGGNTLSGVSWATNNASICTVNPDGSVSAVGAGTAKIIGTYNGKSYSCIVRCRF